MTKTVLLRLPTDDHKLLKMVCASEGKSINKVVTDLIYKYLKNQQVA